MEKFSATIVYEAVPARHSVFRGKIISWKWALNRLRERFGAKNDLGLFCRAYALQHGNSCARTHAARARIRQDYRTYAEGGEVSFHVLYAAVNWFKKTT